jgi:hypothetical protein
MRKGRELATRWGGTEDPSGVTRPPQKPAPMLGSSHVRLDSPTTSHRSGHPPTTPYRGRVSRTRGAFRGRRDAAECSHVPGSAGDA